MKHKDTQRITYNGIRTPAQFPPRDIDRGPAYGVLPVPYLKRRPEVIDISVGRQLFVDDFLIEESDLVRQFHKPRRHPANPIFFAQTETELGTVSGHAPMGAPFSDGVWYDGSDGKFKMWYQAGWFASTGYAESTDGLHWERVKQCIIPYDSGVMRDSCAVVMDNYHPNAVNKYKLLIFNRPGGGMIYDSADGKEWNFRGHTASMGDRSTFFYNPFREKWVYSIRSGWYKDPMDERARRYSECADFVEGAQLPHAVYWTRADRMDGYYEGVGQEPSLYNLDVVAYESIMLGGFTIFSGPENEITTTLGIPKRTCLHLAYSRDGFHFDRTADRTPFLAPVRENPDSWERGYIHSNNALCIVNGDELWFYYTAFQGDESKCGLKPESDGMYSNARMGLAKLRRDGFASLNSFGYTGSVTTRKLRFDGSILFVNAEFPYGSLQAEILDENGAVIPGYEGENCRTEGFSSTKQRLRWQDRADLSELAGRVIRIRFTCRNGALYSFWISPDEEGHSRGYLAGGGVGYKTLRDE